MTTTMMAGIAIVTTTKMMTKGMLLPSLFMLSLMVAEALILTMTAFVMLRRSVLPMMGVFVWEPSRLMDAKLMSARKVSLYPNGSVTASCSKRDV